MIAPRPTAPRPATTTTSLGLTKAVFITAPLPVIKPHPKGLNFFKSSSSDTSPFTFTILFSSTMLKLAKLLCPKNLPPIDPPFLDCQTGSAHTTLSSLNFWQYVGMSSVHKSQEP